MPSYGPVPERAREYGLTDRELEVLCLAAEGLGSKEAAERLRISDKTVRVHLSSAARKLDARNTTHAVNLARDLGIIAREET